MVDTLKWLVALVLAAALALGLVALWGILVAVAYFAAIAVLIGGVFLVAVSAIRRKLGKRG